MSVFEELSQLAVSEGIKYGLERIQIAAKEIGHPETQLNTVIHVAGTNGKGSVTHFLAQMAMQSGLSVGTYTSPHIYNYTERIQLNLAPISEKRFKELLAQIKKREKHLPPLTEFELLTLMAFLEFKHSKPDLVILETGLGGRLDATNIGHPNACIITQIGIDHEDYLGKGIRKIAAEKAGILKKGVPTWTTVNQNPDALSVISQTAQNQHVPLHIENPLHHTSLARYQHDNLALAYAAFSDLYPEKKSSLQLEQLHPPFGRFTIQHQGTQDIIYDVCHNPLGFKVLIDALHDRYLTPTTPPSQLNESESHTQNVGVTPKISIIIGVQKSKDIHGIIDQIHRIPCDVYLCEFNPTLTWHHDDIQSQHPNIRPWTLHTPLPTGDIVVIAGSFYFLEHFKKELNPHIQNPTIAHL